MDTKADTICAIATAPGVGGLAVIRISGPDAVRAADSIWRGTHLESVPSHTVHLGHIIDPGALGTDEAVVDQGVATVFRAPRSFTGQDTVEFSLHGSEWIQSEVLKLLCRIPGVRMAEAGEFTRRAFASGRIDLTQAEAVADVIASRSRAEARMALTQLRGAFAKRLSALRNRLIELTSLLELELDFSEEEVEFASRERLTELASVIETELTALADSYSAGRNLRNGIPTAIIGPTNAGKSSLLNLLVDDERAIVSEIHGTTRDIVEDTLLLGDYRLRLMNTAGLRNDPSDPVEAIGIERSIRAAGEAAVLLIVIDAASPRPVSDILSPLGSDFTLPPATILILNKGNLINDAPSLSEHLPDDVPVIYTSAVTRHGIEELRKEILRQIERSMPRGRADEASLIVTNRRHAESLREAAQAARQTLDALRHGIPGDLVAQHLRQILHHLGELTGAITTPTILQTIFSRFCIGK